MNKKLSDIIMFHLNILICYIYLTHDFLKMYNNDNNKLQDGPCG